MIGASSGLAGLVAAALHGLGLLVLLRLWPRLAPTKLHVFSAFGWHGIGTVAGLVLVPGFNYWTAAAVYWFCFMGLLYVYSAFSKAISLKVLRNLVFRGDCRISPTEIYRLYIEPSFIQRVGILVTGGLVLQQGQSFEVSAAGRDTAGRIRRLQRLFGIDHFGLYYTESKSGADQGAPDGMKPDGIKENRSHDR